jgi:hypothetical protein
MSIAFARMTNTAICILPRVHPKKERHMRTPLLTGSSRKTLTAMFTAVVAAMSAAQAKATEFQISALGLDTLTGSRGVEFHGMLSQAEGDFFTALPSLPDGIHVCEFSATFQDNDATHDLTATLERRSAIVGSSADHLPQVLAKVKSAGANVSIRKKSTEAISNSTVDTERFAYFIRVSLPAGNTINLVRLAVDLRISC